MPTANASAFGGPSHSLCNRIARAGWNVCWTLFFRASPRPCHAWRSWVLRMWGARLGRKCHIYPGAVIWAPWNLVCGDEVGIADGVTLYNQAPISLGRRCVLSQGSYLCTGTHDYTSPDFRLFARPIEVGSFVWIAAEAFVHPGVVIGEGTVVGARSVVTKNLPPWMVCAGNPCRPIKPRVIDNGRLEH
jgi:putative colanic acid biosynthesis acetyltransferase WcaF